MKNLIEESTEETNHIFSIINNWILQKHIKTAFEMEIKNSKKKKFNKRWTQMQEANKLNLLQYNFHQWLNHPHPNNYKRNSPTVFQLIKIQNSSNNTTVIRMGQTFRYNITNQSCQIIQCNLTYRNRKYLN